MPFSKGKAPAIGRGRPMSLAHDNYAKAGLKLCFEAHILHVGEDGYNSVRQRRLSAMGGYA